MSAPGWLTRILEPLKPRPARIPWSAATRASLGMALPLALGFATGYPAYGALVSMGALSSVLSDTATTYRMRVLNIAVPQLFSALGLTVGILVYGHGWIAVTVVTAIALVSGMISVIGTVSSASGLLLLMSTVIGAGLPMPGPWWLAPVLMGAGGALVLALALLAWPLRGDLPERAAVADTYRAVANLLDNAASQPQTYAAARQELARSLDRAYDLILARRLLDHSRNPDLVRLVGGLNAVVPIVEAAPAAHQFAQRNHRPVPTAVSDAVRTLADAVDRGFTGPVDLHLPTPDDPVAQAVDDAVRHAAALLSGTQPGTADDQIGRPAPVRERLLQATHVVLLSAASWRYGLRLALCIGLAQALVSLVEVPRSYWVALAVTFVMKPDFGSVFSRAVLRAVGTATGLLVAAAVLTQVPRGWWDVLAMALLAPLIPVLTPRGYGYQTAAVTPVILLLSDLINHQGAGLVAPRLYDSLIGCAIALFAGYLLWPQSWATRVGDKLAAAVADTARYIEYAFLDPDAPGMPDRSARARMRRQLFHDLSAVRMEFQRALTEPPPMGTRAVAWMPLVVAVEQIVDTTTAARIRMRQGAPWPPLAESRELAAQLETLARGLREPATVLPSQPARPENSQEDDVLEPLRRDVRAALTIASELAP
ncbi:FUSC family protein [Nocardia huaxiensis]|uniref:FUSC family protein n=1 Tax=Nocardia huaxiensis TaxID=2755382 RepID=UPI001C672ECD|nr:FUSC family protein [Nocardia huaxiensis]